MDLATIFIHESISFLGLESICFQSSGTSKHNEDLSTTSKNFKCPNCYIQFQSKLKMQFHLALKHQSCLKKTQEKGEDKVLSCRASCPFCGKTFLHSKSFDFHKQICSQKFLFGKSRRRAAHWVRLNKKPHSNKLYQPPYSCTCGQNFQWKSLFFHHKRKCKVGKQTKPCRLPGKDKNSCHLQKEESKCTEPFTGDFMDVKLSDNLFTQNSSLSNKIEVLSNSECLNLPSRGHEGDETSRSEEDPNLSSFKNDSLPLYTLDKSLPYISCKEEQPECEELDKEEISPRDLQESRGLTTSSLSANADTLVLVKEEQPADVDLPSVLTEKKGSSVEEEACSMKEQKSNKKSPDVLDEVPADQGVKETSENFFMEDEVAVVDLSNMNVSMSISRVQEEKRVNASCEFKKESQLHHNKQGGNFDNSSPSQVNREDQNVLNLSKKSNSREDKLEMQRHYHTSVQKQVNQTFSQCPNCLGSFKSPQELYVHIQNSQCRYIFDVPNTKTIQHRICRICNMTLGSYPAYVQHLQERHGIQGVYHLKPNSQMRPCKICGQKFLSEAYLREHVQGKHSNIRRYACTCGKTFKWRSSFSGHRRSCSGTISCINKPFPTTMCRYTRKRQGSFSIADSLPLPSVSRQDRERPLQPKQIENDNGTGKIPGVHTILNDLKDKFLKPNSVDTFTDSQPKDSSTLQPRVHTEVAPLKLSSRAQTNSLKTDLNSPATQKIIESLKQRTNVKWPTNKNTSKSDFQLSQHSSQPAEIQHTPHEPSKSTSVSSAATNADFEFQKETKNTLQTESNIFMQNSGNPYGMVFPIGDSMVNLTQYLQYQNSFGFGALNMQQLYHQMSSSLSKIFSSQSVKANPNEDEFNRNTHKSSCENFPVQYVSKTQNKSIDMAKHNFTGNHGEEKSAHSSASFAGSPYPCPNCKMLFSDKASMEMHVLKCKSRAMSIYTCTICGMKLRGKASLREHTLGKHSATRYSCSCGMKFKWRSSLGSHQKHCNKYI